MGMWVRCSKVCLLNLLVSASFLTFSNFCMGNCFILLFKIFNSLLADYLCC